PGRRAPRASVRVRRRNLLPLSLDVAMLAAAVIGLLVAAYLTFVDVTGSATLCFAGSNCDVVRTSSFGSLLGLPVSVLGIVYFGIVAVAVAVPAARQRGVIYLLGGVG